MATAKNSELFREKGEKAASQLNKKRDLGVNNYIWMKLVRPAMRPNRNKKNDT